MWKLVYQFNRGYSQVNESSIFMYDVLYVMVIIMIIIVIFVIENFKLIEKIQSDLTI